MIYAAQPDQTPIDPVMCLFVRESVPEIALKTSPADW